MPDQKASANGPRRVAVVTVGRSDFSILKPLCELLNSAVDFDVSLWVGGAHFDEISGMTIRDIEASGLPIGARIVALDFARDPAAIVRNAAAQTEGYGAAAAEALGNNRRPDLVLILGDRFEAIAAALAMVPFGLAIGHLSGGSITEGAMDDMFRHALTKLSALHFCDLPEFAQRIQQMGEEPWRIFVTGALGLDGVIAGRPEPFDALVAKFGLKGLHPGYVLATLHPETVARQRTPSMARAMIEALEEAGHQVVYTYPNADPGSDEIIRQIETAATRLPDHYVVRNFGQGWFYSAMAHAGMCVGNSSSGIYEAASFGLPVVDIGERQKGRFHGKNVIHCADGATAISAALLQAEAIGPSLKGMINPYGDGRGADRVLAALRKLDWSAVNAPKVFSKAEPDFEGQRIEPVCS